MSYSNMEVEDSSPDQKDEVVQTKVGIVVGLEWRFHCDRLPKFEKRTSMVLSLIKSYELASRLLPIQARQASLDELKTFHSIEYIEHCQTASKLDDPEKMATECESFGLEYDCPPLPDMYGLLQWVSGGSLAAAESLVDGSCTRAINWGGGWHHAQRDEASGFCYVNDIVLAIHELKKKFDRVLYVDLDVHHGDGVENAFAFTKKVFTYSLHKYEQGFFPGTGALEDVGMGNGKHYCLNVPLKEGISDDQYLYVFKSLYEEILFAFRPDAVVVQCGSDSLALDPLGGFNLTLNGLGQCVSKILTSNLPTLFLGGGGYNQANAARCWTYLTWLILAREEPSILPLKNDIPDTDPFFTCYGPSFELPICPGMRPNLNTKQDIDDILEKAFEFLDEVS